MNERGPGVTTLIEEELLDKVRVYDFPNLKVVCDEHGILRTKERGLVECTRPECQAGIAARKQRVREAVATPLSEGEKRRWQGWRTGTAKAKEGR